LYQLGQNRPINTAKPDIELSGPPVVQEVADTPEFGRALGYLGADVILSPSATQPSLPSAGGARGAAGYIGMDELKVRLRSRGSA
jgi:hypothetical protein